MSKIENLESYLTDAYDNLRWAKSCCSTAQEKCVEELNFEDILDDIRYTHVEDFSMEKIEDALNDFNVESNSDDLDELDSYLDSIEWAIGEIRNMMEDDSYEPRHARKEDE